MQMSRTKPRWRYRPLLVFTTMIVLAVSVAKLAYAEADAVYTEAGADTCLSCHNGEAMLSIFRTAHGQQADPEAPMASLQCESCHGPGGEHADKRRKTGSHPQVTAFGAEADTEVRDQDAVCMGCHQGDVHLAWEGSVHERNETGCSGCHNVHSAVDPITVRATQNQVCMDCHTQQQADARKPSSHPLDPNQPLRPAAMTCTDCHNPHAGVSRGQLVRNTTNELCTSCHAEYRGPVLFEHAPVSEDCSLCHQPHGSIHPALLTRTAPLLCQSCHSQQGHPSISYTSNSLPGGNPSNMVVGGSCSNCHTQVHGSNHPSGFKLMR
jgi:DmsE family decaheme c-type cytochrome